MPETRQAAATVVVTRPLAQATGLAGRIAALGRHVEIFPLLDILPLEDEAPLLDALAQLADFSMAAFVSPNAIDAVFAKIAAWPPHVTIAVMGQGSRDALARHGVDDSNATIVSPLDPERTDSDTLLEVLDLAALRGKRVLIARGDGGRELLADALRAAGAQVTQVASYRRAAPVYTPELGARLCALVGQSCDWLVTSSEALRGLLDLLARTGDNTVVAKMLQQRLIVPHARIAQTARELGFVVLTLTASGDEALLAALQ